MPIGKDGFFTSHTAGGLHDTFQFAEDGTLIRWHQTAYASGGQRMEIVPELEALERFNNHIVGPDRGSFNPSPEALSAFGSMCDLTPQEAWLQASKHSG
jgi:hypothetical protein